MDPRIKSEDDTLKRSVIIGLDPIIYGIVNPLLFFSPDLYKYKYKI